MTPVILDFDRSVGAIPGALEIALHDWQETIRFGCRWSQMARLEQHLDRVLPPDYGCLFTGSGDYHHLSWLLLRRLRGEQDIQLIVCDNHPDNMRYPFGIHCGSWVYWASRLPGVRHIHVIGIGSDDIATGHSWENHWSPLLRGRLTYWSTGVDARWLRMLGAGRAVRAFPDADSLMASFLAQLDPQLPVYLSVDKDVLSPSVVNTNWDQGELVMRHLQQLIAACDGRLVGADITGDVSAYHYQSCFKRWLSAADGQFTPSEQQLEYWQKRQNAVSLRLLAWINAAWRKEGDGAL